MTAPIDIRRFVFIAENEVFMKLQMSSISPAYERLCEIYSNNPTFVNCTNHPDSMLIENGWTWDGTDFHPPA